MKKSELRTLLRTRRRALSVSQQTAAHHNLFIRLARQPFFKRSERVALYCAQDGEISVGNLIKLTVQLGKKCYLPALEDRQNMVFRQYRGPGDLEKGHFGILQPGARCQSLPPQELDLVIVPLVGFDMNGNRLGFGGGYYDRTFSFLAKKKLDGPYLVGAAHQCQKVERLEAQAWDIRLGGIATEQSYTPMSWHR